MQPWSGLSLGFVGAAGDLVQLFPAICPTGVDPATATAGQLIREPCEGKLYSIQIQTDGANGGVVEIWDVNGFDAGINVSSAAVITDAQLDALAARGLAQLVYQQNVLADGSTPTAAGARYFSKGLAARFVAGAGACKLNLVCEGGYRLRQKVG